jgi:ribosomal protein L40E
MKLEVCRDCGALVAVAARGCPQCARNLEAERKLAKYFWLGGVPLLIMLMCIVIFLFYGR